MTLDMLKTIMWYQLFFEESIMTFIMSTISDPIYKKKLSQQEFKYLIKKTIQIGQLWLTQLSLINRT